MNLLSRQGWQARTAGFAALTAIAVMTVTGCGGGGGGGNTPGGAGTGSVSGTLVDTTTSIPLANRTVTVQNTGISATTDASGHFVLINVPAGADVLVVTDNVGGSDGSVAVTVSGGNSSVDLGQIKLDVSSSPPPSPV